MRSISFGVLKTPFLSQSTIEYSIYWNFVVGRQAFLGIFGKCPSLSLLWSDIGSCANTNIIGELPLYVFIYQCFERDASFALFIAEPSHRVICQAIRKSLYLQFGRACDILGLSKFVLL